MAVTGQPTETYSYDDADRLLSVTSSAGTKGFTYDNDGRCTSETWNSTVVKTYSWGLDGRMTGNTGSWGTRTCVYNCFGARVSETGGAGRQWFRRGPSVTAPVLKDGVNRYTPGTSLRALAGGTSTFQHGGLKSLDAQTDASQAVSGTKTYDAFGATASSTGSWQGQSGFGGGFGYQSDSDTGLQLLGHRYYDPSIGRFLSRDPAKDGPNWYAYCLNDPVNSADPSGNMMLNAAIALGERETYLYAIVAKNTKEVLKWGITCSTKTRYRNWFYRIYDAEMSVVAKFPNRKLALECERLIVGTEPPGLLQGERWAGKLGSRMESSGGGLAGIVTIAEGVGALGKGLNPVITSRQRWKDLLDATDDIDNPELDTRNETWGNGINPNSGRSVLPEDN